ncbi:MAG: hypothetical protein ACOCSE_02025, partial [Chitinivibrionales bacterium]
MNKIPVFHIEVIYFPVMVSFIEKNYPGTLVTLIVLLFCGICAEEANPERVFRLDYHSGRVLREARKPGKHWQEIKTGSYIKSHEKIKTGKQAEGVELSDTNTSITLRNDTRVYINSPENSKRKHITLYKGGIFFFPNEMYLKNRGNKFEYNIST